MDQSRRDTERDVLDIALQLRDMLSNEEIWYVLQTWKNKVREDAKEENKEDHPSDHIQPSEQPWSVPRGNTASEREEAEFQGCGPNCI